jgi:iron complex transport system ATP-binding protein
VPASPAEVLALRGVGVQRWSDGAMVELLRDVDLTARAGEHWIVMGPNGAGKTTLLHLAGALIHPTQGTVEVLGERLGGTDLRVLRERIGLVDARSARALPGRRDVRTTVLSGAFGSVQLQPRRMTAAHDRAADELLALTGIEGLAGRRFEDCSQGERQRVLLARALMAEPRLLLLDEPHAGLDLPSRERLVDALGRLGDERPGLPTVTVTHHVEEIPVSATHALLLRDGRVLATGPVAGVLTSEHVSACFGLPVRIGRSEGRWSATLAARPPELRTLAGASPEP